MNSKKYVLNPHVNTAVEVGNTECDGNFSLVFISEHIAAEGV